MDSVKRKPTRKSRRVAVKKSPVAMKKVKRVGGGKLVAPPLPTASKAEILEEYRNAMAVKKAIQNGEKVTIPLSELMTFLGKNND